MRLAFLLLTLLISLAVPAQSDPQPYALYDAGGKRARYKKMIRAARGADVILFGESHNSAIAHWLQHQLARDLAAAGPLTIGMEMFETDQQRGLDGYLAGTVTPARLDSIGSGLWPNFATDYQPLVDFARDRGFRVVATNVPRRHARRVFRQGWAGLDSLSGKERTLLPPLPIPYDPQLPGYVRMLEMMPGGHGGETFPMAQALKDATMAWFLLRHREAGRPFLHLNGSYHSDDFEGIGWYLRQYAPELRVITISTVEQPSVAALEEEHRGKADFIIAVPDIMTKTY